MKAIKYMLVFAFCVVLNTSLFAQQSAITGTIKDAETGQPLPGVTVLVKGTTNGTTTDFDGNYEISATSDDTIIFTYIGYVRQEIKINGSSTIDLSMTVDNQLLDEVVVTGVFDQRTRMQASVAISTMGIEELSRMVPNSSADLLKNLPGVYVNTSSGEIGNSIYTRGLSAGSATRDGNFRYVSMQEDGLPVIGISGNVNPDYYLRADATIAKVEAVRGGSAAILGPNAPGGIFNYISKTGGTEFEGEVSVRGGLEGDGKNPYFRTDVNIGGPLSKDKTWTYNLGGFFRNADGAKYPGYNLSNGGQLKGNILKKYDKGSFKATVKYLNDRTAPFEYTPSVNFDDPRPAPGFDNTTSLLIQPQQFTVPGATTGLDEDLMFDSERLYEFDEFAAGLHWNHNFGDGWRTSINTRYSSKQTRRNTTAVVSPVNVLEPNGFPFFWAFSGNFFQFGEYEFFNTRTGESYGTVTQSPPQGGPFPTFTNNNLNLPGSDVLENVLLYNPAIYADTPMDDWLTQISISKKFDNMSFTGGLYHANTNVSTVSYVSLAASGGTYTDRPDAVGIRLTDLGGNELQATSPTGLFGVGGGIFGPNQVSSTINQTAFFFGHNWDISEKLNLDWGLRMENFKINQDFISNNSDSYPDGSGGADGNTNTTYDNSRWTLNPEQNFEQKISFNETFSYSFGLNYLINDNFSLYGRYASGRKTPDLSFYYNVGILDEIPNYDLQPEKISSVELGLKYRTEKVNLFVTPFYSQLSNIPIYLTFQDDTSPNLDFYVPDLLFKEYNSYGIEIEGNYMFSDKFSIRGVITLQDSNVPAYETWIEGEGPADDTRVTFEDTKNANVGNMVMLSPTYSGNKFRASLNYQFMGERWANEVNAFKLPAFHSVDLNLGYAITKSFDVSVNINNLFNTYGIMAWEGPGNFTEANNIANFTQDAIAANPNAVFTTQSIMPRAYFTTLTYKF